MNDYDVNMELAVESVKEGENIASAATKFGVGYWVLRNKCLKQAWYTDRKKNRSTPNNTVKRRRQARKMFRDGVDMKTIAGKLDVHERTIYSYVEDIKKRKSELNRVLPAPKRSFLSRMFGWMRLWNQ